MAMTRAACKALGWSLLLASWAATAVELLPDGDFESGRLAGWTVSGQGGGIAAVASEGECYSSNDTRGIVFEGNFAGLLRSDRGASPGSVASLTSAPFEAGVGVSFRALTETMDIDGAPDMPVEFGVRILAEDGAQLLSAVMRTAVLELQHGCPGSPVNGAFSSHFVNTRPFAGRRIRLQFAQSSLVRQAGLFTLVDEVYRFEPDDSQVLPDRPGAVAGISLGGGGRLRLDGSESSEPSGMPLVYSWTVAGEPFQRDGPFPCIDDLDPGRHQATLVVSNGINIDADTVHFVIRRPEPGSEGDGDGGDDEDSDGVQLDGGLTLDCGDGETLPATDSAVVSSAAVGGSMRFHHYNAAAWDGGGVAVVLCPGESATAASIDGRDLVRHGGLDEGREVWTDYDSPGLTGELRLTIGGSVFTSSIVDGDGMTEGDCWSG